MKYLIVSDIHGSITSALKLESVFLNEKCDYIINLGDVLYHGPRNDLPESYEPKKVIEVLNKYSDKTICINGNCDAEVDQMVLKFEIKKSFDGLFNGKNVHLEHGHHLDLYSGNHDIIFYGHTHVPVVDVKDNQVFINPGSMTIPKNGSERSYIIWDNNDISFYNIDGKKYKEYNIND